MSECPNCGNDIEANGVELSELIQCDDCGSDLEVISLDPIVLDNAPEEEEDWGE